MKKLSDAEFVALEIAERGELLEYYDTTIRDEFDISPGIRVFNKLENAGLLYITDEDLIDDENPELGTWTPSVQITEEGM